MIGAIISVACVMAALLVAFLALECFIGSTRLRRSDDRAGAAPPFIVLMPAHDEQLGIGRTIRAVMAQLRTGDRLIVVADNCSDDTAAIAQSLGAEVLERSDPALRGKGYALEFGRAELRGQDGQVMIILDADCIPQPGALIRLASRAAAEQAVVQGAYLLTPSPSASTNVRLSSFAFMIKNLTRQRGLQRLAGAALLQGSGMAFPRHIFDTIQWRAASLVEDLDMGLDLLLAGERVIFDDRAMILSDASSESGTAGQRRRWEHGMLHSMARYAFPLLGQALEGRPRLALVGLDLLIPPTVILICGAVLTLTIGVVALGPSTPVWSLLAALAALAVALASAWRADGRDLLPASHIGRLPAYIVWKLPIAASFLTQRENKWIRTEREP